MALFVLGAGATRGASFVDAATNPFLPPLDTDFYSQLQRIQNTKHRQIVRQVIKDTVELFGVNFQVTMETVFTTLEHTARMIETTGENRNFKRKQLDEKKERLKQAIAAVLEDSLCPGQHAGTECEHHKAIVDRMKGGDGGHGVCGHGVWLLHLDCLRQTKRIGSLFRISSQHRSGSRFDPPVSLV